MLRGLQDARIPAVMGFVSYWLVGLPVGAGLGFGFGLGAIGVWWGSGGGAFRRIYHPRSPLVEKRGPC